jgi:hypothetical protein
MSDKNKKLLFRLILIGLLSSGFGGGADAQNASYSAAQQDNDPCEESEDRNTQPVPWTEDGLEAEPETLCQTEETQVTSNRAAFISLEVDKTSLYRATGTIRLVESLIDSGFDLVAIEVRNASYPETIDVKISQVQSVSDGFTFNIEFPQAMFLIYHDDSTEIEITAILALHCGDSEEDVKEVASTTLLYLCVGPDGGPQWNSSGADCTVCWEVSEMAADPTGSCECSMSALAGRPRAEILPMALIGRIVYLLLDYWETSGPAQVSWHASTGKVIESSRAGAIWELPRDSGAHQIQAVVKDGTSATVAAFRIRHQP